MTSDFESFIQHVLQELQESNTAIFAGPGLSNPTGLDNWKDILHSLAKAPTSVALGQNTIDPNLDPSLLQEIANELRPTESHEILSRLPIRTYWTINYDRLVETALKEVGKKPDVKYAIEHLSQTLPKRDAVVYKLHGDIRHMNQTILAQDDYERQLTDRKAFVTALAGHLVSKTFLFLGFDPADHNLTYILNRSQLTYKEHGRQHYLICNKIEQQPKQSRNDFEDRIKKQNTAIENLKRFNIRTLLISNHEELTMLLRMIALRYKRRTVFISGSAHEFGDWGYENAQSFLRSLSGELINRDYKLVTGVGYGIGPSIIEGALEKIYAKTHRVIGNQLVMRPFPQTVQEQATPNLWLRYRKEMSSKAGIALFLFGNKLKDGKVVNSEGVYREFELARQMGAIVIPVGATGYQARELWKKVMEDFDSYFPGRKEFKEALYRLGEKAKNPQQILENIFSTLDCSVRV